MNQTVMGLINLLESPTNFKLACEKHAAQIIAAHIQDDLITINVASGKKNPRHVTLTGKRDQKGVLKDTYQAKSTTGSVLGNVLLNFDQAGSAQGMNEHWGGAISIQNI